jgi:hypothetical protein
MDDKDNITSEETVSCAEAQGGSPLTKFMPTDPPVWREARRLIADKSLRVEDLSTACVQDPVIVLELLKVASALYFSGGRGDITTVKTALMRLGSDVVTEQLDFMGQRPQIKNNEISQKEYRLFLP